METQGAQHQRAGPKSLASDQASPGSGLCMDVALTTRAQVFVTNTTLEWCFPLRGNNHRLVAMVTTPLHNLLLMNFNVPSQEESLDLG